MSDEKTIQARIPTKLYKNIETRIKSGMYSNKSEVVREALRHMFSEQKSAEAWENVKTIGKEISKHWKSKKSSVELIADRR